MFFFAPFLPYAHVVASQKRKDVGTEALNIALCYTDRTKICLTGGR